jgi:hypothetical protein
MKTIVVVTEDGHIARALSEFVRTVLSEMYPAPFQVLPLARPTTFSASWAGGPSTS